MAWIKELFKSLTMKDMVFKEKNKGHNPNMKIDWSITCKDVTLKQYEKRWDKFHTTFKHKLIYPVLILAKQFIGKYITTPDKIDEGEHNHIFHMFNETYEETLAEMVYMRQYFAVGKGKKYTQKQMQDEYEHGTGPKLYRLAKDLLVTIAYHDTYYRTLFEALIINLAYKIMKKYPKGVNHLFYASESINDRNFRVILGNNPNHIIIKNDKETLVVPRNSAIIIQNDIINDKIKVKKHGKNKRK